MVTATSVQEINMTLVQSLPWEVSQPGMAPIGDVVQTSEDASWMPITTKESLILIPVMLALVALLQSKAHLLWSDSRALRKLRTELEYRSTEQLRLQVEQSIGKHCTPDEIFAHLYIHLSKGRQRRIGKIFAYFYVFFTWGIDLTVSFQTVTSVLSSDVVSGIRLLIAVGSLTVLGARPLTIAESICILSTLTAYILTLSLVPPVINSMPLYIAFVSIRSAAVFFGLVSTMVFAYVDWKYGGTHVSSISNAILKKTIHENTRQSARLERMRNILRVGDHLLGTGNGPYWHVGRSWVFIAVTTIMFITNVLDVYEGIKKQLTSYLITEAADFISLVLLFFNETQVEPALVLELLVVADGGDPEALLGCTTRQCNDDFSPVVKGSVKTAVLGR